MGGGDAGLRSLPGRARQEGAAGRAPGPFRRGARGAGASVGGGCRVCTHRIQGCVLSSVALLTAALALRRCALRDPRRLLVLGHHVLVLEPCRSKPEIKARPCVRRWEERSSSVAERRDWRAAGARARWQPYPRQPSRRPTGRSHRCRSWLTARFAAVRTPTPAEQPSLESQRGQIKRSIEASGAATTQHYTQPQL